MGAVERRAPVCCHTPCYRTLSPWLAAVVFSGCCSAPLWPLRVLKPWFRGPAPLITSMVSCETARSPASSLLCLLVALESWNGCGSNPPFSKAHQTLIPAGLLPSEISAPKKVTVSTTEHIFNCQRICVELSLEPSPIPLRQWHQDGPRDKIQGGDRAQQASTKG